MSEIFEIMLTSSVTIITGISIFVIGQIILKFFVEPIHEQRRIVGEIAEALIFYSNIYSNPTFDQHSQRHLDASQRLRQLSTLLMSKTHTITNYDFFFRLGILSSADDVEISARSLILISNSLIVPNGGSIPDFALRNADAAERVIQSLNLRIRV